MTSAGQIKQQAERRVRAASPWIEPLGRFGFAAKGMVYILVGVLAARVALGVGGETTDAQGALRRIVQAPFGQLLLIATAIGLAGYALWRFVQAAMDTDNKGSGAKGSITRAAYAVNGVIHAGLALSAARLVLGTAGGESGDATAQGWTARLLAQPLGQWLVGIAGAIVLGVGGYQLYRAYKVKFREELLLGRMSATEEVWITRLGRLGYAAQGTVFGIAGVFLIAAARSASPEEARGLGGALATLARQPYGLSVLGAVAVGLVAYGLYTLAAARYRRMVIR